MKKCYLCSSDNNTLIQKGVRDNDALDVIKCESCGLVFLSSDDHINDNFYRDSGMRDFKKPDYDELIKRTAKDDLRRFNFCKPFIINKRVLDFGCGSGGFIIHSKEATNQIYGLEVDKAWLDFYKDNKLNVFPNIKDIDKKFDVITMFHVLEHFPDPVQIFKEIKEIISENGKIIIEVPNSNDVLFSVYKSKEFAKNSYWSCHLNLFNTNTLSLLANKIDCNVDFIKQTQRYPLSNHLYWLSKGKKGGHEKWWYLDSPEINTAYENQLASIGACDTLIAMFSFK